MEGKRGGYYCAVRKCKNNTYTSNVSLFYFPKDQEKCNHWLRACGRQDLIGTNVKNRKICSEHFRSEDMTTRGKRLLLPNAEPILHQVEANDDEDCEPFDEVDCEPFIDEDNKPLGVEDHSIVPPNSAENSSPFLSALFDEQGTCSSRIPTCNASPHLTQVELNTADKDCEPHIEEEFKPIIEEDCKPIIDDDCRPHIEADCEPLAEVYFKSLIDEDCDQRKNRGSSNMKPQQKHPLADKIRNTFHNLKNGHTGGIICTVRECIDEDCDQVKNTRSLNMKPQQKYPLADEVLTFYKFKKRLKRRHSGGCSCSVRTCGNYSYNSNASFFQFPMDQRRCKLWLRACGRQDLIGTNLRNRTICSAHFRSEDMTTRGKRRVLPCAFPTLLLPPFEANTVDEDSEPLAKVDFESLIEETHIPLIEESHTPNVDENHTRVPNKVVENCSPLLSALIDERISDSLTQPALNPSIYLPENGEPHIDEDYEPIVEEDCEPLIDENCDQVKNSGSLNMEPHQKDPLADEVLNSKKRLKGENSGESSCSVRTCRNFSYNSNVSFFLFPRDRRRCELWLRACGRQDLIGKSLLNRKICSAHFQSEDMTTKGKRRMLPSAFPTRLLPPFEANAVNENCKTFNDESCKQLIKENHTPIVDENHTKVPNKVVENCSPLLSALIDERISDSLTQPALNPSIHLPEDGEPHIEADCEPFAEVDLESFIDEDCDQLKNTGSLNLEPQQKDPLADDVLNTFHNSKKRYNGRNSGGNSCSVRACRNFSYNSNVSFFKFPKDQRRCQLWLRACGRQDLIGTNLRNRTICSAHFRSEDMTTRGKRRVLPSAFPTRSLPPFEANVVDEHCKTFVEAYCKSFNDQSYKPLIEENHTSIVDENHTRVPNKVVENCSPLLSALIDERISDSSKQPALNHCEPHIEEDYRPFDEVDFESLIDEDCNQRKNMGLLNMKPQQKDPLAD